LVDVLVDGESVIHLELPRVENPKENSFQTRHISEYEKKNLSRPDRRRFELALQLAAELRAENRN